MKNDKDLLNDLNERFCAFEAKLDPKGYQVCKKELLRINKLLHRINMQIELLGNAEIKQQESYFVEIMYLIKEIMQDIDDEVKLLEVKIHDITDYSYYANLIKTYKKKLKEVLTKMLIDIYTARPELKGKQPFLSK